MDAVVQILSLTYRLAIRSLNLTGSRSYLFRMGRSRQARSGLTERDRW